MRISIVVITLAALNFGCGSQSKADFVDAAKQLESENWSWLQTLDPSPPNRPSATSTGPATSTEPQVPPAIEPGIPTSRAPLPFPDVAPVNPDYRQTTTGSEGLDRSFGEGGFTVLPLGRIDRFGTTVPTMEMAESSYARALVSGDGQILIATCLPKHLQIRQLSADGKVNAAFGAGGIIDIGLSSRCTDAVWLSERQLIVISDTALARYNIDGTADLSFGKGGTVDVGSAISSLVVYPDRRMAFAGSSIGRVNQDGSIDEAFAASVATTFAGSAKRDMYKKLAIQSDGKLIVAAEHSGDAQPERGTVYLERLDEGGSLDKTFGSSGVTWRYHGAAEAHALSLMIQPDDSIILATRSNNNDTAVGEPFAMTGYDKTGVVATTFKVDPSLTPAFAGDFLLGPSGQIIIGGLCTSSTGGKSPQDFSSFCISRYLRTGILDPTFGSSGFLFPPAPRPLTGSITSLFALSDDAILAAGFGDSAEASATLVARFVGH